MAYELDPLSPNGLRKKSVDQGYAPYFTGGAPKVSLLDSVNGKHGAVRITGGANTTVDNSGEAIVINTDGGGGAVASVVAGTNIDVDSTDPANPVVSVEALTAADLSDFTEAAQDAVGTILTDSPEIDFTYNDATPSISATIVAGSIDETKLDTSTNASLDLADTAVQPNTAPTLSGLTVDTTTLYVDAALNRVGIGTTGPDDTLHVIGNFRFADADPTPVKSMRFRTNGGDIDVEGAGKAIFWSVWSAADYTGTQRNKLVMKSDADVVEAIRDWEWKDAPFGTTKLLIKGSTGQLTGGGALAMPITTVAANTTLDTSHYTVLVNAASASLTMTLPAAADCPGRLYNIKKIDASVNTVIIDANAAETIDGAATQTITTQWASVSIQSNGTGWFII